LDAKTFLEQPHSAVVCLGVETMLGWALVFLIVALAAAYLGFFALAGMAAMIAKLLFVVFIVLLVVSFIARALRGGSVV